MHYNEKHMQHRATHNTQPAPFGLPSNMSLPSAGGGPLPMSNWVERKSSRATCSEFETERYKIQND